MRIAHVVFGLLFVFAGCVNFNDPQPIAWVTTYFAAAAICFASAAGWCPARVGAMILGLVTLVWSLSYVPAVLRHGRVTEMFDQWTMKNQEVVENREMFGLLIVAVWMAVVVISGCKKRRA